MSYYRLVAAALLALAGCGGSPEPEQAPPPEVPKSETAFTPLVETLERAESVQQTLDAAAAERRRRLKEQEQ